MPTVERKFVQALPTDNPHLSPQYVDVLKDAFKHRPQLLEAYLYGNWDVLAAPDQIIRVEWLRAAQQRRPYGGPIKKYIACDVARFGDDETVIYLMNDADIQAKAIMPHCATTEVSNRIAQISRHNGDLHAVIESTGSDLGAGVIDELGKLEVPVIQFNPSGASHWPEKYYNLRAEAWDKAAESLCKGIICQQTNAILVLTSLYPQLQTQLCAPTYKFRGSKLLVEAKEDIKKRLNRSPDHADTYVIALWAWSRMPNVIKPVITKQQKYRQLAEKYRSPFNV